MKDVSPSLLIGMGCHQLLDVYSNVLLAEPPSGGKREYRRGSQPARFVFGMIVGFVSLVTLYPSEWVCFNIIVRSIMGFFFPCIFTGWSLKLGPASVITNCHQNNS